MRALPLSMMAHSPSTCQCNSRTPPAVSRISTPAMVVETGNSRDVTCRVHPPLKTRLRARAKEYLNGFTVPLSVDRDHSYSEHLSATYFRIETFRIRHVISFLTKSKTVSYIGKRIVVVFAVRSLIQEPACKKMSKTEAIGD